jgi:hypothetical protein
VLYGLYGIVRRLAVTQYNYSIYVKWFRLRRLCRRRPVTLCQIERYGKDSDVPITQAPNRKSLLYMVLRHFFEVPIIQAPKRKSRAAKEMWLNSSFLMWAFARAGRVHAVVLQLVVPAGPHDRASRARNCSDEAGKCALTRFLARAKRFTDRRLVSRPRGAES